MIWETVSTNITSTNIPDIEKGFTGRKSIIYFTPLLLSILMLFLIIETLKLAVFIILLIMLLYVCNLRNIQNLEIGIRAL